MPIEIVPAIVFGTAAVYNVCVLYKTFRAGRFSRVDANVVLIPGKVKVNEFVKKYPARSGFMSYVPEYNVTVRQQWYLDDIEQVDRRLMVSRNMFGPLGEVWKHNDSDNNIVYRNTDFNKVYEIDGELFMGNPENKNDMYDTYIHYNLDTGIVANCVSITLLAFVLMIYMLYFKKYI